MAGLLKIAAAVPFVLSIVGCAVTPKVLTEAEIRSRVAQDMRALTEDQEPVRGAIDVYEAMARALKYNLDTRVELMQKMLAHQQLDLSHHSMLPRLVANGGYDRRSNFSGGRSQSLLTGQQSLEASTGSDRGVFTGDLSLSWDVLDFGLSYIRAKQAADDVLIAEEEKRRVANRVIQDVRTAYWRAVSADRVMAQLERLEEWVTKALENSKTIQRLKLNSPLAQLRYRRELINRKREIQKLNRELSTAKLQLAALMNLPPVEDYEHVIPDREAAMPKVNVRLEDMEQRALLNRPELRAVDYRKRINAKETKAAILELLPNLTLEAGKNYNSNSFLFHNHWLTYGAKVSWNLLNLFRQPIKLKTIEAQEKVLEAQSLALTMAVMTQVHVGAAQVAFTKQEWMTAKQYYETQGEITKQTRLIWLLNRLDEQRMISERVNLVVAQLRYDTARANVESGYASLWAAIGEDALPGSMAGQSVAELAEALEARWTSFLRSSKWTARQRLELNLSIVKGETSVAEAARKHGLSVEEVEKSQGGALLDAEDALRTQPKGDVLHLDAEDALRTQPKDDVLHFY